MTKSYLVAPEWLIDGTGSPYRKGMVIRIEEGMIVSVTDGARLSDTDRSHGDTVDLHGFTILPGLIDSHVHLVMSGSEDPVFRERQMAFDYPEAVQQIQYHLKEQFRYGVMAVRDGGDKHGFTLQFRDALYHPDREPFVSAVFAGKAWHREGRYGGLIGRPPASSRDLAQALTEEGTDTDVIKIVNSGLNSLKQFGRQTSPQFQTEELRELVRAAGEMGRKVMVHANGTEPVAITIDAGCDSVEHGFFMERENIEKMAERGTAWVPTAVTMAAYSRVMQSDPVVSGIARKNLDRQLEQLRFARECGARTVVGTDAGSPGVHHGRGMIEEMKLFMDAGYSLEETVMRATSAGAELLGLTKVGRLQTGMDATFLAVPGPPSHLPDSLDSLAMICCRGRMVYKKQ